MKNSQEERENAMKNLQNLIRFCLTGLGCRASDLSARTMRPLFVGRDGSARALAAAVTVAAGVLALGLWAEAALGLEPSDPSIPSSPSSPSFTSGEAKPSAILHAPVGPLHPHTDPDWLALLEENARRAVASGEFARRQKTSQKMLETQVAAPRAAVRLPKATEPTIRHLATVAAVNPKVGAELSGAYQGFKRTYLFIDAEDPAQLAWAKRELAKAPVRNVRDLANMSTKELHAQFSESEAGARTRLVLLSGRVDVAGKVLKDELHRISERPMFDQSGQMVRALDLKALPARAVLTFTEATVETFALDAEGNVLDGQPRRLPDGIVGGAVR